MRILYVEDNQDTAEAVQIMLTNAGYEVDLAFCGDECFKKTSTAEYNLILLDVMLPDMTGWDILSKLKNKVNSKFGMLSAIPVSHDRLKELVDSGLSGYITKPFSKNDLIDKVNRWLKQS